MVRKVSRCGFGAECCFLNTWRGVAQGLGALLSLEAEKGLSDELYDMTAMKFSFLWVTKPWVLSRLLSSTRKEVHFKMRVVPLQMALCFSQWSVLSLEATI